MVAILAPANALSKTIDSMITVMERMQRLLSHSS
jgi:hypothetical protein